MIDHKTYTELKPMLDKIAANGTSCSEIAEQTGFSYSKVIRYFSYHLKFVTEKRKIQIANRMNICPTCGKLKHEVNDETICRDMIHFKDKLF